jgi:AmmeMemoRadiSam system protein B
MHVQLPVPRGPTRGVRVPAHAGTSYPAATDALRAHLDRFFLDLPPARTGAPLAGLVAPHIDLRLGGRAYAHAYATVRASPAARYLILGTSHVPGTYRFSATRDHYATPLGVARTDRAFLDRLAGRVPVDLFRDRHLHAHEHAIEFQVVMLQHVLADPEVTIVPILVSSFHDLVTRGIAPNDDPEVDAVVHALRATLAEDEVPTVVIAGVDFAHVGVRFGDRQGTPPALLATVEEKDRRLLATLEDGDAIAFWQTLVADGDRTRICGAAPLAVFLELMWGRHGRMLCYDRFHDERARSCVTCASVAFPAA